MALLEVRNLSVAIRRTIAAGNGPGLKAREEPLPALNGVSLSVAAGEIVALAGESGCGKSLTALSIARLLPPAAEISGGEIRFGAGDKAGDLLALGEKELCRIRGKEIAMIFQEPRQSLNPLMRVGAQIAETLELHGAADAKKARAEALDMIERLGMAEPARIYRAFPHQLSGGMCQRVMIALAAICRPRLLIADEPVTALDGATQEQILDLLGGINRESGAAILFISHDLSVVRRFCRRCLVMYAGRLVEEGPTERIFSVPAHPYTRGLIGAIPGGERRGRPLANISGRVPAITDRLPGCPFAPRCPQARARCSAAFPPETELGQGHRVHCAAAAAEAGHA
jgi:oligopeptide/dipeptide ABC transporter ATP-binding protein